MPYEPNPAIYEAITAICLTAFDAKEALSPVELMEKAWAIPDFPMHCPEHHFLVPAALLTVYRRYAGDNRARLSKDLDTALSRAKNVPGGSCGNYGACGAAVGAGIFLAVFTDCTPYSAEGWADANMLTGECLRSIAAYGGPRCCKRTCFTAVLTAETYMRDHFRLHAEEAKEIVCSHHDRNNECLRARCPYYPTQQVFLPRLVDKQCCDGQIDMAYKKPVVTWRVASGDRVKKGDPLLDGESDKTTFAVNAPCSGTVGRLFVESGAKTSVREPVCEILR